MFRILIMSIAIQSSSGSEQLSLFAEEEIHKPVEIDTVYQYLLVLAPPDESTDRIRRLKYQLNNLSYLGSYNLFSVPHITLAKLQSVHRQNTRFGRALQKEFTGHGALQIDLNGFQYFSHGPDLRTLYLQIEAPEPVEALYTQLNTALGIPLREYVPHLTVAKTISTTHFDEIFPVVSVEGFKESFRCDHILVLERTIKNQKVSHYKAIKKIRLGSSAGKATDSAA